MALPSIFENSQPIITRRIVLKAVAANTTFILPAFSALRRVIASNRDTAAVTGLTIGTTSGGTDILPSTGLAARGSVGAVIAPLPANDKLAPTAQTVFINATSFGALGVDLTISWDELPVV